MPTSENWLNDSIIQSVWEDSSTSEEVQTCFDTLAAWLEEAEQPTHILFNIQKSSSIPTNAPMLAVHSGFLNKPNTGKVVVVGMQVLAQIMARVAASVSRKNITFFPDMESALSYLGVEQNDTARK